VETLRCPTCLSVLRDGSVTRCPSCRARLKGRKSLVLREEARIASRPVLAIERERKARVEAENAAAEQRRYRPATIARLETPHAPRILEPEDPAPPPPPPRATRDRHDASPPRRDVPAPPRREEPEPAPGAAASLFDLLADYTVDGAPERVLPAAPPVPATVDVPAPIDDAASEPAARVTGKTRSRLLRRRPLTPARRMDDALASVRVEVKAEALKRMLEPEAAEPAGETASVEHEAAVVESEVAIAEPPAVALATMAEPELAAEPEIAAPASTEVEEPVAELPVRPRWAWRRKEAPDPTAEEQVVEVVAFEEAVEVAFVEGAVVEDAPEPAVVDEPVVESEAIAEAEPVVDLVAPPASDTNRARSGFRFRRLVRRTLEPVAEPEAVSEAIASVETPRPVVEDVVVDDAPIAEPVEAVETSEAAEAAPIEELPEAEPEIAAESQVQTDELATRVDASVDALLALIPDVVEEPAEPEAEEAPPIDARLDDGPERVVEEPIARVDAAVQALMALLPGSVEVIPDEIAAEVEAPTPLDVATDDLEDPVDAPSARVVASVDELMAIITRPEAPVDESERVEQAPAAFADAAAETGIDAAPEPSAKPRRRRGARRRAELAAAIAAAARALDDSETVAAEVEPESVEAERAPVEVVAEPEPVIEVPPVVARSRLLRRGRKKHPVVAEEPRTTLFDVEPIAAAESLEPVAEAAPVEPDLAAPTLDLVYETETEPEPVKPRRKRRGARRAERTDDGVVVPVSLFEHPPPEPASVAPEPLIDPTVPEPDVVAPAIEETAAASIVDIDLTSEPAAEPVAPDTRGRARGWRVRRSEKAVPSVEVTPAAARDVVPEVVVPEVVVPEVVVPEVVVPEVVVPEVVVPEVVSEPVHELQNGNGNGNGNRVEVVADEQPLAMPVEILDAPTPVAPPTMDLPAQTRAVRVKTVKVNGKRRWVVDVLVRQEDQKPKR
jgi:hypothetical protein